MGKNKNKKTNATTKGKKEDGPAREKNRQEKIRASKRKEEEDEINLKELEEERKKVKRSMKEKAERMKEEEARLEEEEEEEASLKEEEEEARLKEAKAKEARLKEEEEARLKEKQKNKSQFGGLTYLVIEFPKGGQFNRFKKLLGSQHYIPLCTVEKQKNKSQFGGLMYLVIEFPKGGQFNRFKKFLGSPLCTVKGIYVKMDAPNSEKSVDGFGLVEMKNIFQGRRNDIRFLPLSRYNKKLLKFLKHFMPNMLEPFLYIKGNVKRNIEWYTEYYWRLKWLNQGFPHVIDELDFYWKIFNLYSKFRMDRFLLSWWGDDAGYYKVEFPSEMTEPAILILSDSWFRRNLLMYFRDGDLCCTLIWSCMSRDGDLRCTLIWSCMSRDGTCAVP